jgi:hypothetical protein
MIMSTFAESFDFRGKTIHPFVTYAVSELWHDDGDLQVPLHRCESQYGPRRSGRNGETGRPARVRAWLRRITSFASPHPEAEAGDMKNAEEDAQTPEVIIHLAFYAGWPKALSAVQVAKNVLES